MPENNYNSNIKDHWSQITITKIIIMKTCEILQELLKCDIDTVSGYGELKQTHWIWP